MITKNELIEDIEHRCLNKCDGYLFCINEIKKSKEADIFDKDSKTQCRLYVDEPDEPEETY